MVVRRGTDENDRLRGSDERDSLLGLAGNDQLFGLGDVDVLDGGAGRDLLNGGAGRDRLRGGAGNDIYIVDESRDRVVEGADSGVDTVRATADYRLRNNVENLRLQGNDALTGLGNELNNSIRGNRGNNTLNGLGGSDVLGGRGGDDLLNGGAGDDRLSGGAGVDRFTFASGSVFTTASFGLDTIVDFVRGTDRVVLSKQSFGLTSAVGNGFSVATEFVSVANQAAAETSSALIVFNQSNNSLIYNQNGTASGFGSGGAFATTQNVSTINATDITIVA